MTWEKSTLSESKLYNWHGSWPMQEKVNLQLQSCKVHVLKWYSPSELNCDWVIWWLQWQSFSQSYIIPLLYLQLLPLYMEVVFTVNIKSILKKFSHSTSYGSLCIPLKSNFCNNIMCRNGTDHHCEPEKVSGGLPLFWDWVEHAKYAGTRKYHERTLDIWQFEVCTIQPGT